METANVSAAGAVPAKVIDDLLEQELLYISRRYASSQKIRDIISTSIGSSLKEAVDFQIDTGNRLGDKFWSEIYDTLLSDFEYSLRHQCGFIDHRELVNYGESDEY